MYSVELNDFVEDMDVIVAVRTIHGHGRVQLPSEIRRKMHLKDGDKIAFIIDENGDVYIKRADIASIQRKGGVRSTIISRF